MEKKLLIDAAHPEETRVVVAESSQTHDFDFESNEKAQITGNIYLAKVTRVEPSLQAAFLDYGGNRHGFLAFSEIHPDYYQIPLADKEALLAEQLAAEESIDEVDKEIVDVIAKRIALVEKIDEFKKETDLTTFQVDRWNEIFKSRLDWAIEKGLDKDFIEDLYKVIHLGSINVQNKIINRKKANFKI